MCDGRLQYRACEARAHLASHTDNRVEIEAVGGIECIARAMRSHPTDSELQFSAYRALAKLARHAEQPGQDGGRRRNALPLPCAAILPTASYNSAHTWQVEQDTSIGEALTGDKALLKCEGISRTPPLYWGR
jgi:hypothetical protein